MNFPGLALIAGGVLTMLVNAVLSPLMLQLPPEQMAASDVFLVRLNLAAAGVLALGVGLVGLRERHAARAGRLGMAAYWLAVIGTMLIFAHEWAQVFFVHPLSRVDAEALRALEYGEGPSWIRIEAIAVLSVFSLGWLAFAVSLLAARTFGRLAPALIVGGIFAIPMLAAAAHGVAGEANAYWGAIVGNLILSSGWILLGRAALKVR